MATVLERRFPQFGRQPVDGRGAPGRRAEQAGFNPDMLAHTCREAARRIEGVELARVFNPAPLRRSCSRPCCCWRRSWPLPSPCPTPWASGRGGLGHVRRGLAAKDATGRPGFENGPVKVASGGELEVIATADTHMPLVPETVQIRYRVRGRAAGRHHHEPRWAPAARANNTFRNTPTPSAACWPRPSSTWSAATTPCAACRSRSSRAPRSGNDPRSPVSRRTWSGPARPSR